MNRNLEIQNKVAEMTQTYTTKEKSTVRRKRKEITTLSIEKLLCTNEILKKTLNELGSVEKRDGDIRLELSNSLR